MDNCVPRPGAGRGSCVVTSYWRYLPIILRSEVTCLVSCLHYACDVFLRGVGRSLSVHACLRACVFLEVEGLTMGASFLDL